MGSYLAQRSDHDQTIGELDQRMRQRGSLFLHRYGTKFYKGRYARVNRSAPRRGWPLGFRMPFSAASCVPDPQSSAQYTAVPSGAPDERATSSRRVLHRRLLKISRLAAAYHDVNQTIMATRIGQEILRGRHISVGGVTPHDRLISSSLCVGSVAAMGMAQFAIAATMGKAGSAAPWRLPLVDRIDFIRSPQSAASLHP